MLVNSPRLPHLSGKPSSEDSFRYPDIVSHYSNKRCDWPWLNLENNVSNDLIKIGNSYPHCTSHCKQARDTASVGIVLLFHTTMQVQHLKELESAKVDSTTISITCSSHS